MKNKNSLFIDKNSSHDADSTCIWYDLLGLSKVLYNTRKRLLHTKVTSGVEFFYSE